MTAHKAPYAHMAALIAGPNDCSRNVAVLFENVSQDGNRGITMPMKADFDSETYHPTILPVFPFQDNPMGRLIRDLEERIIHFRAASMTTTDSHEVSRFRAKADTLNYVRAEIILALEEMDDL